jgi:predicted amidophosphoribosyltransferase
VLDLVLPRRCVVCRVPGVDLCGPCREGLPRLGPVGCARCGAPTAWPVARCLECSGRRLAFVRARAAAAYEGDTRRLVAAWKERGLRRLARDAAALVVERLEPPAGGLLTFVPADGGRRLDRGYHPAERLAAELAAAWELPFAGALTRRGASRRQPGLTLAERRRHVRGAFAAGGAVRGRVVLVDDVYTSGATADAAASALRAAGAAEVEVVTFARTIRRPGLGLGERR